MFVLAAFNSRVYYYYSDYYYYYYQYLPLSFIYFFLAMKQINFTLKNKKGVIYLRLSDLLKSWCMAETVTFPQERKKERQKDHK